VAKRVVVMGHGRIEQIGTPAQIYDEPANAFVYDFIGESIKLPVVVDEEFVRLGIGRLPKNGHALPPPGRARLFVRPHDLHFSDPSSSPLLGEVRAVRRIGPHQAADISLNLLGCEYQIETAIPAGQRYVPGEKVGLTPKRYRVFEPLEGVETVPAASAAKNIPQIEEIDVLH
jgi:sulfate transport system ATP-binding protein